MKRTDKQAEIERLKSIFRESKSVFLMNFRGLKVVGATELRKQVRGAASSYKVVKNTLAVKALEGTGLEGLSEHFAGPTAIAFTTGDPVALAKTLTAYAKQNPVIVFKAGVVEGKVIADKEIKTVAEMPSKDVLRARLLFLMSSPMRRLVTVLSGPQRGLMTVVKAHADKQGEPTT